MKRLYSCPYREPDQELAREICNQLGVKIAACSHHYQQVYCYRQVAKSLLRHVDKSFTHLMRRSSRTVACLRFKVIPFLPAICLYLSFTFLLLLRSMFPIKFFKGPLHRLLHLRVSLSGNLAR